MAKIKDNLRNCTENYALFNDTGGINPLSEIDAEIISTFIDIMIKLGADMHQNLMSIINSYKLFPDADVLEQLIEYNSLLQPINKTPLINIKNQFIGNVFMINSFSRGNYYDNKNHRSVPLLIINKTENNKIPYANTQIIFNSEDEFEDEFEKIKDKLSKYSHIIFV